MILELRSVGVVFQGATAIESIDLSIPNAKTTVLLGTSGSGKSTILKSILGLVPIASGQILVDGTNLNATNLQEFRRRIGYMTQHGGLFPHLNLRDNIELLVRYLGWSKNRISKRLEELLALTKMDQSLLERFPQEVSGGQRQRASLVRALFHEPSTLILDEPLGALDPLTRYDLQQDLKHIFDQAQKTVILVTHDLLEARFFADQIHVLDGGHIIQSGTYEELHQKPANQFVRKFFKATHIDQEPG